MIGPGGFKTITGSAKIRQDLALALGEPYGNDHFHPTWGSVVPNYVGRPILPDTELLVRSEVSRVVQVYIDLQNAQIADDSLLGNRSRYTTSDVVAKLTDITSQVSLDKIYVKVSLVTQAYETLTVSRTVTTTS